MYPGLDWNYGKHTDTNADNLSALSIQYIQWVPELLAHVDLFHVKKSCKIECCDNKAHQIIQNMILSRGFELRPSLL